MAISRHCPACGGYALAFEAAATLKDNNVIAVIGRCQHCKHKFKFEFAFEKMHTDSGVDPALKQTPTFRPVDATEHAAAGKRESAEKQHRRWLGQDRQTPGEPYDPYRVSTSPNEGPPDE